MFERLTGASLSSQGFFFNFNIVIVIHNTHTYTRPQSRANVNIIGRIVVTAMREGCAQKYRIRRILNRISAPASFPTPFPPSLYRDIGADRSTLKPHFTPSNYTPKWHRAFPFFLSFRASSRPPLADFLSASPLHPPVYFRAVPPFVFIRAIGKGVRSKAFYLSSCFTA